VLAPPWATVWVVQVGAVTRRLLINRNYALFMGGSFVSALGSWFQGVATGWLVLELTGSPLVLGLANFAQMAPLFFLGFAGGMLADRVDRRLILLAGLGLGTVGTGALAALALSGRATATSVLLVSLLLGLANAVVWPAWQPFLKDLVPVERLREAIAFNAARFNLTRLLGPALAGLLIARVGAPLCLAIGAVSSAGVVLATLAIRLPRGTRGRATPWRAALGEGLAYVRQDAVTRGLLPITAAFGLLVLPYQALLPAYARDVLATDAEGLGFLLTAVGAGAVLGAVLTGSRLVAGHPGRAMGVFAAVAGAGLLHSALLTPLTGFAPWMAVPGLAAVGVGTIGYLTTANAALQLRVPDALVGRVMGLWVVVNAGTMPLGSLVWGWGAERVGLPAVLVVAGAVGLLVGLYVLAQPRWHALCLETSGPDVPARSRRATGAMP
jgi:MFS family permease